MTTTSLNVPALAPGAEVMIGPFEWMPVHPGHECMFMSVSASTDRANNDLLTGLPSAKGPTPAWRLVPSDNNIAMRSLIPLPGSGGRCALEAAFCNRKFWAQNPFAKAARMEVRAVLPSFLASRGWAMRFHNPGGGTFTLGPRDAREIRPVLLSGRDFSAAELTDAGDVTITILVLADGLVVGGLSLVLDPSLSAPARELGQSDDCKNTSPQECCRPECRRIQRCCCEPCIDDRCCKPARPCCNEHPHDDRPDAPCTKGTRDEACGDDDDHGHPDRLRRIRVEIDPKRKRPHENDSCDDD